MILAAACAPAKPDPNAAKPSNAGGTGSAITLTGDAAKGKTIFATRCIGCHGEEGKGGIANDGSDDGTVPPLHPIDSTVVNKDKKVFAANFDLFLQNGSTPEGSKPAKSMLPFGSTNRISQQDIADVIAYIISLNPVQ